MGFGFELAYGIVLITNSHRAWAVSDIGDVLIASLLIGIARAWELVGQWNTSIISSIGMLLGQKSAVLNVPEDSDQGESPSASG